MQMFRRLCLTALTVSVGWSSTAPAQQFDPRLPLGQLISAFQMCGPPQVYQMLSQQLFILVAQQTGGRGCYPQIAQAGPVTGMEILSQQQFPTGPLYIIRVTYQAGAAADWFIGFNQHDGKIESLTFQPAQAHPEPKPEPKPRPTPPPDPVEGSGGDGCDLYPAMC
jgi:hypothetical protein